MLLTFLDVSLCLQLATLEKNVGVSVVLHICHPIMAVVAEEVWIIEVTQ